MYAPCCGLHYKTFKVLILVHISVGLKIEVRERQRDRERERERERERAPLDNVEVTRILSYTHIHNVIL